MAEESEDELKSLVDFTGLTSAWCEKALRHLTVDDVSRVVEAELTRLRKVAIKRAEGGMPEWDEASERKRVGLRAHHLFATQEVRPILLESLALASWDAVVEQARTSPLFESDDGTQFNTFQNRLKKSNTTKPSMSDCAIRRLWIQRQLGLRLGTDVSNIWRWEQFKTLPGGDKVLGAILIVLRCEFHQLQFPSRRRLISTAVARTVAFIHEERYGKQNDILVKQLPTPVELAILRFALRHCFADDLLMSREMANKENIKGLIEDTISAVRMDYPSMGVNPKPVKRFIEDWGAAYALFLVGLASGWPDTTVEQQFWEDIQ